MNLENWSKVVTVGGMYVRPDEPGILKGNIYGHPTIADGTFIYSDEILGWDYREQCFVDAKQNEYRLKNPDPTYEQRFPNSNAKVEKAIKDRKFMMSTADYMRRYREGNKAA